MKKDEENSNPSCRELKKNCLNELTQTQDQDKKKAILEGDTCQNLINSACYTSTQKSSDCKYCKNMCPIKEHEKEGHCLLKCESCKRKSLTVKLFKSASKLANKLKELVIRCFKDEA